MTSPTIFVTAVHQFPERVQDAMAVWVDELRVDNFKICLREAKIFDGPHKNIKIVSKIISFLPLDNSDYLSTNRIIFTVSNYKSMRKRN